MSVDFTDSRPPLVVRRWRRWGHDRAYVQAGTNDLGYRDLVSGEVCCDEQAHTADVGAATEDMYLRAAEARRAKEYRPRHSVEDVVAPALALLPDRDLALNRPGQAVRERAYELRDAAPVKTLFARVRGAKTDERAYRIGADGEEDVARELAKLGRGWRVLHAIPVGSRGSDIDHVVIGPAGVFTINTKNHPDAKVWVGGTSVRVNGFNQRYVPNSRHEAARAVTLLGDVLDEPVRVRGMVVIVGASLTVATAPSDVDVLARKAIVKHLRSLRTVLSNSQVEAIYAAARHLSTWQPHSVARQEFAQAA